MSMPPTRSTFGRLVIFLSITWILLASFLYFSHLGESDDYSPSWTNTWYSIAPIESFGLVYGAECTPTLQLKRNCNLGFSPLGFSQFLLLPLFVIWFLGLGISWVLMPKRKPNSGA